MAFLVPARGPSFLPAALLVAGTTALFMLSYQQLKPAEQAATPAASSRQVLSSPDQVPNQFQVSQVDPKSSPRIQLAILLDTSSSMSGLIDQARAQLWRIVNELAEAKRNGKSPRLEIAVYEYGNSGLEASRGYIKQVSPFVSELDLVSEALFSLTTSGGSEHAGQAISFAHSQLDWDSDPSTLRLIYIAGNETFAQGPVDYRDSIAAAAEAGIIVNTVHCGGEEQGANDLWASAAAVGGGRYLAIDHNAKVRHIAAPQDDAIAKLGVELNGTYMYYGAQGYRAYGNQVRQDNNASGAGMGSSVQRAVSKSGRMYDNGNWDLVDGMRDGKIAVDKLDKGTLAPELQSLSDTELSARVAEKGKRRAEIQKEIQRLERERRDFVASEKSGAKDHSTLDDAIISSLREQGSALGYDFE